MTVPEIAAVCHEANKKLCETQGDISQAPWSEAPSWQRQSAVDGVVFHLDSLVRGVDPAPSASHESWLRVKEADGWEYGPVKDPAAKQHPCFVPYDQLPPEQKVKDYIFGAIVKACFAAGVVENLAKD